MNKIIIALLIVISSLCYSEKKLSDHPTQRVIKVGAFNYYPGIFKDSDDSIKGFIVDILDEIAREENWNLQYVYGSWNDGLQRIKENQLDVLTSVAYTKERSTFLKYSSTEILTVWSEVYSRNDTDIEGVLSLDGKKIAVMKGDFNGASLIELINSFKIKCTIIEFDSFETIFNLIETGHVDAGVVNNIYGAAMQKTHNLKSKGIIFNPFNIYFAAPKNRNEEILLTINSYLSKWKKQENSPYHKAIHKWSYQNVNIITDIPTWLSTSLLLAILGFVLAILFIYLLRRQVKIATRKIEKSEAEIRVLVQSLDDVVFTLDLDQKHTGVYGKWLDKNGLKPEYFLGKTTEEILGSTNSEIHVEANRRALSGEDVIYEWSIENQGIRSYTQTSLSPIRNKNGKIIGLVGVGRDITELKKTEQDLIRNEHILRLFIQYNPASIAMFDNDMRYIIASNRFLQDYDLPLQNLAGKSHYEVFPEITDDWKAIHKRCLAGEIVKSDEDLFQRANGKTDWVRWEIHPWYEGNGKIGGIILFSEVITEQKKSADLIRESVELFRMIFESSPYAITLTDSESGAFRDINYAFEKLIGYTKEEVMGKTSLQLGVWLHPDDRTKYIQLIEKNGLISDEEYQFRIKNGQIITTKVTARFLNLNDKKYMLSIINDITEQKKASQLIIQSREMLAKLTEQVPGVVYQYRLYPDGSSSFPYASSGMIDIYGFHPDEVKHDATPVFGRIYPDDYNYIVSTIQESAKNLTLYHSEFRVVLPNIGIRWRLCDAKPEKLDDGSILWYGIITDITERKLTEAELESHRNNLEELVNIRTIELDTINLNLKKEIELKEAAEKQLEEALNKEKELSNLKSRFISTASHEFRTPLTAVLTSAELIQRYHEKWDKAKLNGHLDRIMNSVANLTSLMDSVLTLNRAESGKTKLQLSLVNLQSLCKTLVDDVEIHALDDHDLVIEYNLERTDFLLDQKQIEHIIHNLVSNAIKYSPSGGKINVKVSEEKGNLIFIIEDCGIGIPEEELPLLFEPFHRAKNAIHIQGTGLGLSIVKHAVDLHGGKISVESKENMGAKFTVEIPIIDLDNS